jgi:hypothetical protein
MRENDHVKKRKGEGRQGGTEHSPWKRRGRGKDKSPSGKDKSDSQRKRVQRRDQTAVGKYCSTCPRPQESAKVSPELGFPGIALVVNRNRKIIRAQALSLPQHRYLE